MSLTGTGKATKPQAKYDVLVEGAAGWISAGLYDGRDEALGYARSWLKDQRGRVRVVEEVFDEERSRFVRYTIYDRGTGDDGDDPYLRDDAADKRLAPAHGGAGAGRDYFWSRATEITLLIIGILFLAGVGCLIYFCLH